MSRVMLKSNAVGSGTIILETPPINSKVTIRLPSESGILHVGNTNSIYSLNSSDLSLTVGVYQGNTVQLGTVTTSNFNSIENGTRLILYFPQGYSSGKALCLQVKYLDSNGAATLMDPYNPILPVLKYGTGLNDTQGSITSVKAGTILEVVYFDNAWRLINGCFGY